MDSFEIIAALSNVVEHLPFNPKDGDIVSYNGDSALILYRYSKIRNLWCFVRRHERLAVSPIRVNGPRRVRKHGQP